MFNKIKEWLSPKKYGGGLSYGNVGTHVLPIQATASDMATGIGVAATVTYPAIVGKSNCISGINYTYSGVLGGLATNYLVVNTNPSLNRCCTGPDGNIWVADRNAAVWKVTPAGVPTKYTLTGAVCFGICTGPDGNLWVTDQNGAIWKLTTSGVATKYIIGTSPIDICAGPDGNLWAADTAVVWKITTSGVGTSYSTVGGCFGICAGPDGNLWVASYNNGAPGNIIKLTTAGSATTYTIGSHGFWSICTGPDGNLWAVNGSTGVYQITTAGTGTLYTSNALNGGFSCCAGPDGNIWIAQAGIGYTFKVTPSGVITSYAANLTGSYKVGICAGPDGNIWIPDAVGYIWKVLPNALLTVSDGNTIVREFFITEQQGTITFPSPIQGSTNTAMTITLSGGGPNTNGTLNVNGFFTV